MKPNNWKLKRNRLFSRRVNFSKYVNRKLLEYGNIILKFLRNKLALINKLKLGFDRGVPSHLSILAYCTPTIISIGFRATSRQFESFRHNSTTRLLIVMDSIKIFDREDDILTQNTKTLVPSWIHLKSINSELTESRLRRAYFFQLLFLGSSGRWKISSRLLPPGVQRQQGIKISPPHPPHNHNKSSRETMQSESRHTESTKCNQPGSIEWIYCQN